MEKSQSISELSKSLVAFQLEMGPISFDADNPFFKSKYATLAKIVKTASPIAAKHNLAVIQPLEGNGGVTTILMHTSGEYISSSMELRPVKDDPQGRGSSITYARRYAYAAILGLVSEEDDDGNLATGNNGKEKKKSNIEGTHVIEPPKPIGLRERVEGTGISKFGDVDKFQAWRVDHNLVEDLSKASDNELNYVLTLLREMKPVNRLSK